MNTKKNKRMLGFVQRIEAEASDIVESSRFLVDNTLAEWRHIEMPNGETWLALMFKPSAWELENEKLKLKK